VASEKPPRVTSRARESHRKADLAAKFANSTNVRRYPPTLSRIWWPSMSQPDDVNINEILFRPTKQEL
jgi:NADP-dependent 3-hydroxy acid dehydrogenase YdfG